MKLFLFITLAILAVACHEDTHAFIVNTKQKIDDVAVDPSLTKSFHFETHKVNSSRREYKIFENGHLILVQKGTHNSKYHKTYASRFKAAKAAKFIIYKLNNHKASPLSISEPHLSS